MSGLTLIAHAISQIDAAVRGIHVLWAGPTAWGYAESGYTVERRSQIPRPDWQCVVLDGAALTQLRAAREIASLLGPIRIHAGAAPVVLTTGAPVAGGAWEVITTELVAPTDGVRVVANGKWMQAIAFAGGKPVAASPVRGNTLTVELAGSQIDCIKLYAQSLTDARVCADRTDAGTWSGATELATLQLPLVELIPTLGGPAGELALAQSRLLPGETMAAQELSEGIELVRALVKDRTARPIDHALLFEDEPIDGERAQPVELCALDPLRVLLGSPRWRRVLGLAYFDRDPALVAGARYQYRVRAKFPAIDHSDRVLGFHTVPSATIVPADIALGGAQLRLGQPVRVVLTQESRGPGVTLARRAIRIDEAGERGPWWAPELDGWALVIDLPAAARSIDLELDGDHDLELWAGIGDTKIVELTVPAGSAPRINFAAAVDQLRLRGRGTLCALRARPATAASGTIELAAPTPAVVLEATPAPPPPLAIAAVNLQTGANARKPIELGFDVTWLPAPNGGILGWPPDQPPPPGDGAYVQLERRREPSGPWLPLIERDNLIGGVRDAAPAPSALAPGADIFEVFPEAPTPSTTQLTARWRDTFDALPAADRPPPGTQHRYRIRSVDGLGRSSTTWTTGLPITLEKRLPPPPPGRMRARALIAGAPDLTPADIARLAGHASALVVECTWGAEQRAQDAYARELRFYYARLALDAVSATLGTVTPLGAGSYQVAFQLAEPVVANASVELRMTKGYPFAITQHTAGTAITATLRAAVPQGTASYAVPEPGATWFPVRIDGERRRPRRFGARREIKTINAQTDYTAVFFDVFDLSPAHPIDRVLVGVSAADDQSYVADDLEPADHRAGNESALATALVSAHDASQPVLAEAPALGAVASIAAPIPRGDDLRASLDLTPLITAGIPSGPVRLERAADFAIARAYRVTPTAVIAIPPEPARPGDVETPITIVNSSDRAAIISALSGTQVDALADQYLVFLAASHPYRGRLFQPSHERTVLPIVDDTWPPFAARWVYRARALDAAGRISADGRTLRGVVRVPSAAAPPAPHRPARGPALPADAASPIVLRFAATGVDRVLIYSTQVHAPASFGAPTGEVPALIALTGRSDGISHALRMADGTIALPVQLITAAGAPLDAGERVATIQIAAPAGELRRVWACAVSPAGVASSLAGPWLWRNQPVPLWEGL